MKQADLRKRLFRDHEKPQIDEALPEDLWKWVRLSQLQEGKEYTDEEFMDWLEEQFATSHHVFMLSDRNSKFASGFGPIGVVAVTEEGTHVLLPHVEWFPWATTRNRLRASVQFFMKFRRKGQGIMRVHVSNDSEKFFKNLKKYVPLWPVGKIASGDRLGRGDDFIFSIKGHGS